MKYFIPLESGNYYHIFNRAIGDEKLFKNDANYMYFLRKFNEYISPIADTCCYVLMPNHFHFLINIKPKDAIYTRYVVLENSKEVPNILEVKNVDFEKFVMQQFSNFFNCYTKSFNKMFSRKGALFIDYLKRSLIDTEDYLKNIVLYIHQNPVHHKYCYFVEDWKFSSYKSTISNQPTNLQRNDVLDWFGTQENFISLHSTRIQLDCDY